MKRLVAAVVMGLVLVGASSVGYAHAAGSPDELTQLSLTARTTIVSGRPIAIQTLLLGLGGRPVAGALVRLVATTKFLGTDRDEIVDEAVTDASGMGTLVFAPTRTGTATVTARFSGLPPYEASEASVTVDVQRPVVAYRPAHVGIQAPWTHINLILILVLGIWSTYAVVLRKALKIRRAGPRETGFVGSTLLEDT